MVVAQLVEQSLPTPKVRGSNQDIGKIYIEHTLSIVLNRHKLIRTVAGMAEILNKMTFKVGCLNVLFFVGHSEPLFLYFHLFNTTDSKEMFNIKFADGCICTKVLWYWKQPLYQLYQNHCPGV